MAESVETYRALLAATPGDRIAWHNMASILGDIGAYDEAEKACRRALALGLNAGETYLVLGRALQQLGRLSESQAALEGALDRKPGDPDMHRDYAQLVWMQTGDSHAAVSRFKEALRASPGDLGLILSLSGVLSQVGETVEGLRLAAEAARLAPTSPFVLTTAAYAASSARDFQRALDYARAAVSIAPNDPSAGIAEVQALLALGEALEAESRSEHLHRRFPRDQHIYAMQTTAWRLLDDPRYHDACDYTAYVRAYELDAPEGWKSREQYVDDLIEALAARHSFEAHPFNQSLKGAGSQLTSIDKTADCPALAAFPQAVLPSLRDYLQSVDRTRALASETDAELRERLEIWSVRLRRTGWHIDHIHSRGIISSACHLLVPETIRQGPAGWLRFGKPGIETMPELDAEYHHRPETGILVLFPSYIWHGVSPYDEDTERMSVAMDVV